MIRVLALVVSVAFIAVFGVAFLLPAEVRVERSIEVARPVHTVFAVVDRAGPLKAWVPAFGSDRRVVVETKGPRSGPGSRMEWSGSKRLTGVGFAEIVESDAPVRVRGEVVVEGQGRAEVEWQLRPEGSGTRLTAVAVLQLGTQQRLLRDVLSRWFGLVADSWLGAGLESFLEAARSDIESLPPEDFGGMDITVLDIEPDDAVISDVVDGDYAAAFGRIAAFMAENGVERTDAPMLAYRAVLGDTVSVEAIIPASRNSEAGAPGVRWGETPSGLAVMTSTNSAGPPAVRARARLVAWVRAHGYEIGDDAWERYVSDPVADGGGRRSTEVYVLFGPGS